MIITSEPSGSLANRLNVGVMQGRMFHTRRTDPHAHAHLRGVRFRPAHVSQECAIIRARAANKC